MTPPFRVTAPGIPSPGFMELGAGMVKTPTITPLPQRDHVDVVLRAIVVDITGGLAGKTKIQSAKKVLHQIGDVYAPQRALPTSKAASSSAPKNTKRRRASSAQHPLKPRSPRRRDGASLRVSELRTCKG